MRHWSRPLLAVAVLLALAPVAGAQPKDTLLA
jgi:hypothetical protein